MPQCETITRSHANRGRALSCGGNGALYEVFARHADQKDLAKNSNQQSFSAIREWHIKRGTMSVKQVLCDKHKNTAIRQGREVLPL